MAVVKFVAWKMVLCGFAVGVFLATRWLMGG